MKSLPLFRLAAVLAVPIVLAVAIFIVPSIGTSRAHLLKLTMIDVGQGDSILLETPSGRSVLIDGGIATRGEHGVDYDSGARVVVPFLRHEGLRRIDLVVATHPHADHVGGLATVLRTFRVGEVLDGDVLPYDDPVYVDFVAAERERRVAVRVARQGEHIALGDGVTLDCLNPPVSGTPYGTDPNNDTMNDYSAVFRVTYGKIHILLDGDAEANAERRMLKAFGASGIQADILKCGHHGSDNATTGEWLDAVRPAVALISCGVHNRYGHPGRHTLARLAVRNIRTLITARDGAVTVTTDGRTVSVQQERGGK
ncbi:MAG: ComEC/Rec2 family competence protein [Capsulimonadaceae bacterium]|nr:ComEC/Rec2 family competence protein [Capsulimonadaceae bacterium]